MKNTRWLLTVIATTLAGGLAVAAQHPTMPAGMTHEEHLKHMQREAEMKKRGDLAMGFDQDKVAHHFRLTKDGGEIDVRVKDRKDVQSRDQIRAHLRTIAGDFARGDFTSPMLTHGEVPPGVDTMRDRASTISYTYDEQRDGARVRIVTRDPAALDAVHAFLQYQIREHHTGDPTHR